MPTLSSLLVQHGVTSMRVVEEAIARQVLHGGDLATNVLELGAVRERELTALLAESLGLPPAVGRLRPASLEVLRVIPAELAVRHSVFPLDLRTAVEARAMGTSEAEGVLVIATAEPLTSAVAEELSFALGVSLRQLAAPLVRIRQALAEHYGVALDRRMTRLVKQLEARAEPGPAEQVGPGPAATAEVPAEAPAPPPPASPGPVGAVAPAVDDGDEAALARPGPAPGRSSIEDAPTVEAQRSIFDEDTVLADDPLNEAVAIEAVPTPRKPPLHELDDEPTVVAEYPIELPPLTPKPRRSPSSPEVRAPQVDALAPRRDQEPGAPGGEESAPAGPNDEITLPGNVAARIETSAAELAEQAPSGARPPTGHHLLTGWLRRASDVYRAPRATWPQAGASSLRLTDAPAQTDAPRLIDAPGLADGPRPADAPHLTDAPGPAEPAPERRGGASSPPVARATVRPAGRSAPPAQRRKGPFTLAMAEQELAAVDSSEAVLAVLFAFAQQYFEYTVLFTVHGERAEGRNAAGPGAERERVMTLVVPFDRPNALARARTLRAPLVTALTGSAPDADLQRELGRALHSAVAVVPVVVRGRVVALLYGDDGATSVELSSLGDLVALAGVAAAALERLILRKKLNRGGGARQSDRPAQHEAAGPAHEAVGSAHDAVGALEGHANEGPLSLRTRAALLELSQSVRAEAHGAPVDAGSAPPAPPAMRAEPGARGPRRVDGAAAEPQAARPQGGWSTEDGGSGIDAVARAFGLRGTGVEADATQPDQDASPAVAFDSTVPPAPMPQLAVDPPSPPGLADGVDGVLGTAVTAPMMAAVTAPILPAITAPSPSAVIDEIPDLEIPAAPAPSPPEDHDLGEPEDARTKRYSRPPWMLDSSIMPGADEPRELEAAPVVGRPPWRRRTPVAVETATAYARPPSERRAAVSPSPAGAGDLRAEYTALLQHVLAGGEQGERAFAELVRSGETAISLIAARFPGPLRVDRQRLRDQLAGPDGAAGAVAAPPASQCGPLLELIVAIRRPALPFMTVRSASPDPEVRFWATHVLGELPYPEAANALLPRLFDDSIPVRRIAVRSAALLIAAPPAGGPILQGLDHIARDREESSARRLMAIETMTDIRSGAAVPALISALTDPHEAIVEAAARALVVITRDDHGRDARRWASWWARNGERHRIEWIIDALTHERPALRRAAIDELKGITREYFGYYEDLPRQEREAAQERYRAWWISEGRSRFRTTS
ncbi:hypothetical protein WMF31_23325 [Sorangium sp. So ce1036]|uniref:GspE/PulE/PilB domain-containing protein n=1 Tax=Sorangium sp. So ce1036 TaxID=3133328 RepID=UPI003EFEC0C1